MSAWDDQILLVLDLDETLLFAAEHLLGRNPDHQIPPYFLYFRPGVKEFIKLMSAAFRVGVWTSSSPAYASAVCPLLFPRVAALDFVWASDRCTPTRDLDRDSWSYAKPLRKLKSRGYNLDRVLVVDDSPERHSRNYGNLVQVSPFTGSLDDEELKHLGRYLLSIAHENNVRQLEKRRWRTRSPTA